MVRRALLLNALTKNYEDLWNSVSVVGEDEWSKIDSRLEKTVFQPFAEGAKWGFEFALKNEYARRQISVEIDVLSAMALGMTLQQLKAIYSIQFPVLQQNEQNTWYDAYGRIVFTTNRSLGGIGVDRKTWENIVSCLKPGEKYAHKFTDDTIPGGPVERTIEYVAPFDRCDREKDYETAWKFFEKKYGK